MSQCWTAKLHRVPEVAVVTLRVTATKDAAKSPTTKLHQPTLTILTVSHLLGTTEQFLFLVLDATNEPLHIYTNPDAVGIREAFLQNFPDILSHSYGKPALVIGGWGCLQKRRVRSLEVAWSIEKLSSESSRFRGGQH